MRTAMTVFGRRHNCLTAADGKYVTGEYNTGAVDAGGGETAGFLVALTKNKKTM